MRRGDTGTTGGVAVSPGAWGRTCEQHQVGVAQGVAAVVAQEEGAFRRQEPPRRPAEVTGDAQGFQSGPETRKQDGSIRKWGGGCGGGWDL